MHLLLHNVRENDISTAGVLQRYKKLLAGIEDCFDAYRRDKPGAVLCAPGCSRCCYGIFEISLLDAMLMAEGMILLEPADIEDILGRSYRIVRMIQKRVPEYQGVFRVGKIGQRLFSNLVETLRVPCPVLSADGLCRLYAHRPRICRLAGIEYQDPMTGEFLDDFCPAAKDVRQQGNFPPAEFPLTRMYTSVAEMSLDIRPLLGDNIESGMTCPPAALVEFTRMDRWISPNRRLPELQF